MATVSGVSRNLAKRRNREVVVEASDLMRLSKVELRDMALLADLELDARSTKAELIAAILEDL